MTIIKSDNYIIVTAKYITIVYFFTKILLPFKGICVIKRKCMAIFGIFWAHKFQPYNMTDEVRHSSTPSSELFGPTFQKIM